MNRFSQILLILCFVASCNTSQQECKATITQRKAMPNGNLLVTYQFYSGNRLIKDSVEVSNKIIAHDSVNVYFSSSRPEESKLQIP